MAISTVQQGLITEAEFVKIVIIGTGGQLVPERARVLQINFRRKPPIDSDADYWYYLAHFDLSTMTFSDPVFLVPSAFLHKHARNGIRGGAVQYQFKASMEPGSRDRWAQFRLSRQELGPRILELLQAQGASAAVPAAASPWQLRGLLWLRTESR